MSKSNGEFLGLNAVRNRGYDPMIYRYFILLGHYQTQLAFSWDAMDAAANGYKNIIRRVADILTDSAPDKMDVEKYNVWYDKILSPVSDNMKTAEALVQIQELLRDKNTNASTKIALFEFIDRLLGLQFIDRAKQLNDAESETAPAEIVALANERATAKAARDWARADELRAQIDAAGWTVVDTRDGTKIVKKI